MSKLDPEVFRTATATFGEAVETLNRINADSPVGDAAAVMGQLLTAEACRKADAGMTAAVAAAVESVREYGENLDAALQAYAAADQSAADDIGIVDLPT